MENKNYYPLRLGTHQSSTYILTDTRTNDRHLDHEGCTGWVVAEGLPNLLAQQLVDAYNYVHGCTSDKNKACIGGCMCCQSKGLAFSKGLPEDGEVEIQVPYVAIKHLKHMESCAVDGNKITRINNHFHLVTHYGYEYRSDLMSGTEVTVGFIPVMTGRPEQPALHPLIISDVEPSTSRYKVVKAEDLLTDFNSVEELMDKVNAILKNQGLTVVFNKSIGLAWQELERKADVAICKKENSAHSFTEGAEVHHYAKGREVDLKEELPDFTTVTHKVDVEKVIEDLLKVINVFKATGSYKDSLQQTSACQNAEAALGMLRALKENRFKKESANYLDVVNKHIDKSRIQVYEEKRKKIVELVEVNLRKGPDASIAEAIVRGAELMISLHKQMGK